MMINWFKNNNVGIFFDKIPAVGIRYILPSSTKEEKISIKKYPFINKKHLKVQLADYTKMKCYIFEVSKGYCYDGASIPRLFWRIIGSNTDNDYLIAALIHDILCENHSYVDYDREFSTEVFNALLECSDVCPFKRYLMKHSVNFFQRFCHWNCTTKRKYKYG